MPFDKLYPKMFVTKIETYFVSKDVRCLQVTSGGSHSLSCGRFPPLKPRIYLLCMNTMTFSGVTVRQSAAASTKISARTPPVGTTLRRSIVGCTELAPPSINRNFRNPSTSRCMRQRAATAQPHHTQGHTSIDMLT